eukprot:2518823-Pleurochrysis_carterae.AAC.1
MAVNPLRVPRKSLYSSSERVKISDESPRKSPRRRTIRSILTIPGGFKRGLVLLDSADKRERPYDGRLVPRVWSDSLWLLPRA